MINIILAEDHVLVRKAIRSLFENETDIKVTGEADDAHQLDALIASDTESDIILTELTMPGMDTLAFIEQMKAICPQKKVVFLSTHDNDREIINTIRAGASGYLSKTIDISELLFAIRHIHNNGQYICSNSTKALMKKIDQIAEPASVELKSGIEFSTREIEILTLMGQGYTNYEIADKLFTSKRTIESYRQNLLSKTESRNTASLIKFAMHHGIIKA
jgi:DNA-binding NarL/FixJ family response regulator